MPDVAVLASNLNRRCRTDAGNLDALLAVGSLPLAAILAALALLACSSDADVVTVLVEREVQVVETVIVERELRVEIPVAETVLVERDVPRTVIVPATVVSERERPVPVTVVVEQTRIVERERIVRQTVVVEATPEPTVATFYGVAIPIAEPTMSEPPRPRTGSDTVVIRTEEWIRGSGVPGDESIIDGYRSYGWFDPGDPFDGMFTSGSVTEKLFLTDAGGNAVNQLVEGWRLVRDRNALGGQALIFDLKRDVPFHDQWGDFGYLTSDDVAWSLNLGNPGYTRDAFARTLDWDGFIGNQPVTIIDQYTVRVPIRKFDPTWETDLFSQSGVKLAISSKRAFEEMGEDWARDHIVGTGPYRVKEYSYDTTLKLEAVRNHHRITPAVENIIYEPIGLDDVAVAGLRTGRVDVAVVRPSYYPSLTAEGFEFVGAGAGVLHGIVFPGNYWQDSIYTDDPNDLEELIGLRATYSEWRFAFPWIGDPEDAETGGEPEGLTSMERAALVRRALSHAIDRERIAEVLLSGAGWVNYVYGHDVNNPNYQSRWDVPYDPDLAEELLDRARYPRGRFGRDDGMRFDMPLLIGGRFGEAAISSAVAGMWREIGIDVQEWKDVYSVYEPSLRGRTATVPYMVSNVSRGPHAPWDWPFVTYYMCSGSRLDYDDYGGDNIGFEVRELCEWGTSMLDEQDKSRRIAIRDEIADFLSEWNLVIGVAVTANVAVVNPKKIASWDMPLSVRGAAIHHPEFLVTVR